MKLTLCGSLRFESYWHEANKQLGLSGHICYSVMTFPSIEGDKTWYTPEQKWTLDLAHFAKIEESDGVVMLNIDKYLGESSLRELEWARIRKKMVLWTLIEDRMEGRTEYSVSWLMYNRPGSDWVELLNAVKDRQADKAFQEIHDRM